MNTLYPGMYRHGRLFDRYPDTPDVSAVLHDDGQHVILELSLLPKIHDKYIAWFLNVVDSEGNTALSATPMPNRLWFQDEHGNVALMDCHSAGYRWDNGLQKGFIQAQRIVFTNVPDVDIHRINGMRTSFGGMGIFFDCKVPDKGVTILGSQAQKVVHELKLDRSMNSKFREIRELAVEADTRSWSVSPFRHFETLLTSKSTWNRHMLNAANIQELLMVASGQNCRLLRQQIAVRETNGSLSLLQHDDWWDVYLGKTWQDDVSDRGWFFYSHDLPKDYLKRWKKLRTQYDVGISAFLKLVSSDIKDVEVQIALLGIAIEGIGFGIYNRDKVRKDKSNHSRYAKLIVEDLGVKIPIDLKRWKGSISDVYNAIKHADKERPDDLHLLELRRLSMIIIRIWIAEKIGVPSPVLLHHLSRSNHLANYEYVAVPPEPRRRRARP